MSIKLIFIKQGNDLRDISTSIEYLKLVFQVVLSSKNIKTRGIAITSC